MSEVPIAGLNGNGDLERSRQVGLLAVAHAAFAPARVTARRSILIDSVLRVLFVVGPCPCGKVVAELKKMFATDAISEPLVGAALNAAKAAGLVASQETLLKDEVDWALCDDARRDVVSDAEWAAGVLERFESQVIERLDLDPSQSLIKPERIPAICSRLRQALAAGAAGLYAVCQDSNGYRLRPAQFNERDAFAALSDLQPKAAKAVAQQLLVAAMDPGDEFGDEVVSLLASANVLYGIVTGRDLKAKTELTGMRVLLDTSVIVDICHDVSPEGRAVVQTIGLSRRLGVEVIVAEHSILEWTRLFDSADAQMKEHKGGGSLGAATSMIDNPFIRAFLALEESGHTQSWAKFRALWRDPTNRLRQLGVNVRISGNDQTCDQDFVDEMVKGLRAENRRRADDRLGARSVRLPEAIEADAHSAAMVARWRRARGEDAGFFVARDRMTGVVYRRVASGDKIPLTLTLPAWSVLMAGLVNDDPASQSALAQLIANAAVSQSYFSIAAAFSLEEVQTFAEQLAGEAPDVADVHEFVQATIDEIEAEAAPERLALVRLRGAKARETRALRHELKARRADQIREEREAAAEERGARREREAAAKEREQMTASFAKVIETREGEGAKRSDEQAFEIRMWKRRFVAGTLLAVAVGVAAVLLATGALTGWLGWALVTASLVLLAVGCVKFGTDADTSVAQLVGWLVASVALSVMLVAGERLIDSDLPSSPPTSSVP